MLLILAFCLLATSNAYIIQQGDTYCKIAKTFGCSSWQSIAAANPSQPVLYLQPGYDLYMPSPCSSTPNKNCIQSTNLNTAASTYNIDYNCLMNYNCNDTVTTTICLPPAGACPAYNAYNTGYPAGYPVPTNSYVISSGDTYCKIAAKLGCPDWQTLASANPTQGVYSLQPGNTLTVPSSCTVNPNQLNQNKVSPNCIQSTNLNTVASTYNIDYNCLMNYNCNDTATTTICLPKYGSCPAYNPYTVNYPTAPSNTYTINSGDTYCKIAAKLGCPDWQTLASNNPGQYVYSLQPGNPLTVPSACSNPYCIQSTNLNTVASTYNIDYNCLMNYNCNDTATTTICLPKYGSCPAYTAPVQVSQNGMINNVFYCNGTATVPTGSIINCGGLLYRNGQLFSGVIGSTFYCNGAVYTSGTVPVGPVVCGPTTYVSGLPANGYVNGQFYCGGQAVASIIGMMNCSGTVYNNGIVYTGFVNSDFYCNGKYSSTGTGVCGGAYYNNFNQVHSCTSANNPITQTCQQYLTTNSKTSLQNLIDCNPNLWLTQNNCGLPQGTIYV